MATAILRQYLAGNTPNPNRDAFGEGVRTGRLLRQNRREDERSALHDVIGRHLAAGQPDAARAAAYSGGDLRTGDVIGQRLAGRQQAMDEEREAFGQEFGQFAGNLLGLPEEQQEAVYRSQIPAFERKAASLGIDFESGPMDRDALRGIAARYGTLPKADGEPLQEVYDPNSPTGTSFVRRSEAAGRFGKPPSGQSIDVSPQGGVSIRSGRGAGQGPGLAKRTVNTVQNKQFNTVESLSRLNQIQESFRPEFQEIGTRLGAWWTGMKSRAGMDVGPEERRELGEFAKYRTRALDNLNQTLREMSGAAVNPQEFERISGALPNPGTGVFDGDDPVTFKAKLDDAITLMKRAMARYTYLQQRGFSGEPWEAVTLEQMDDIIDERGEELEAGAREQFPNLTDAQLRGYVAGKLGEEFGI